MGFWGALKKGFGVIKRVAETVTEVVHKLREIAEDVVEIVHKAVETVKGVVKVAVEIVKGVAEVAVEAVKGAVKPTVPPTGHVEGPKGNLEETVVQKTKMIDGGTSVTDSPPETAQAMPVPTVGQDISVIHSSPPERVEAMPVPTLREGSSVDRVLRKALGYTGDDGIQKIGIWGMGGVGKTTLMAMLNNADEIKDMFQIVIWVTVSKCCRVGKLQDRIANRLSLNINESDGRRKSDDEVMTMLFRELESKRCLLLLDDVWDKVDLSKVGIPITKGQKGGSKIVFTTRDKRVCREMETDVEMKMEVLDEQEAWDMFCSKAGEIAELPTIKPIAKEIVRKCGGLPLALNVIGGYLRGVEDGDAWSSLLHKLKSIDASPISNEMSENVFGPLKLSYDRLKDGNAKECFLYCGLYPENSEIQKSELIEYWRAEGLVSSEGTVANARAEGRALLHLLTDASLVEESGDGDKCVRIHNVIRDLVQKMTSRGGGEASRHVARAGALSREEALVEEREWEEATRISFISCENYYSLPEMPNCPNLSALLLQFRSADTRPEKVVIPESFFKHMPMLRVLDLSNTGISSLPSSISNLVSLRALFLNRCYKLETLPGEVRALKMLEMLSLAGNKIQLMSSEIFELSGLRCLQFSSMDKMVGRTLPKLFDLILPNKAREISKLCLLEEVSMVGRFIESDQIMGGIAEGLGRLPRLSTLEFNFVTVNNLQQFLHNSDPWKHDKVMEFCFFVGQDLAFGFNFFPDVMEGCKRRLHYRGAGDGSGSIMPLAVKEVFIRSDFVGLYDLTKGEKLASDLGAENTGGLKYCIVRGCGALENILDGDGLQVGAFPNLQCLQLRELGSLESVCDCLSPAMQSSKSFTMLQVLTVINCESAKRLFCWGIVSQLVNLRYLQAGLCLEMEEMVSGDRGEGFNYGFPKLKTLKLFWMLKLVGFSKGKLSLCCPLLEEVCFYFCPELKVFPLSIRDAPNLKRIKGQPEWWEALEWEDDATKLRFSPLFSVGVEEDFDVPDIKISCAIL